MRKQLRRGSRQAGFTLIETVVAGAILMVGLVSILVLLSTAVAATQSSQEDEIARAKAMEALEGIVTARDTGQITFDQISNVGTASGVFLTGDQLLYGEGADGLPGTADDSASTVAGCPSTIQCVTTPGPDGILGTADDLVRPLTGYTRAITIANTLNPDGSVDSNLKQITVTVKYPAPYLGAVQSKTYTITSFISSFR